MKSSIFHPFHDCESGWLLRSLAFISVISRNLMIEYGNDIYKNRTLHCKEFITIKVYVVLCYYPILKTYHLRRRKWTFRSLTSWKVSYHMLRSLLNSMKYCLKNEDCENFEGQGNNECSWYKNYLNIRTVPSGGKDDCPLEICLGKGQEYSAVWNRKTLWWKRGEVRGKWNYQEQYAGILNFPIICSWSLFFNLRKRDNVIQLSSTGLVKLFKEFEDIFGWNCRWCMWLTRRRSSEEITGSYGRFHSKGTKKEAIFYAPFCNHMRRFENDVGKCLENWLTVQVFTMEN